MITIHEKTATAFDTLGMGTWDGMIDKAIAVFVGAVLTFILCNVGM